MGGSASQGAVRPYVAVPPQESGQADFCIPPIAVGMQVQLLILECAPQPIDQDAFVAALPA